MNKKDFGYNTDCCCLTDREISTLVMKENQALKDRWEKLKEFINEHIKYDKEELLTEKNLPNRYYLTTENMILDKMQELEDRQ